MPRACPAKHFANALLATLQLFSRAATRVRCCLASDTIGSHVDFESTAAGGDVLRNEIEHRDSLKYGVERMDGTGEPAVLPGHEDTIFALAWSPDGRNIATGSADGTARVWRDLEPLHGVEDPVLWKATRYCIPAERQMQLLNISEALARAQQNACERHVEAAFQ